MAAKTRDVKAWARAQTKRRGGRRCQICMNAEVAAACDEAAGVWIAERPEGMSFAAIAEMLGELFGFSAATSTVRNHFLNHRKELHRQICGG